jgi:DNA-binding NtrC family response regulator
MRQLLDCDLADISECLPEISPVGSLHGAIHHHLDGEGETGRRIMVVDDYPDLADAAKMVLETEGYEVTAFREREMALRAFVTAEPRPMLLITDYFGGPMSGIGLIKICKAIHPQLKVLMVSGIDYRRLSDKELRLIDGALNKPYSAAELLEQVHRFCGTACKMRWRANNK